MHTLRYILIAIFALLIIGYFAVTYYTSHRIDDIPSSTFTAPDQEERESTEPPSISVYATNRQIIWAMDFLPDGRMIFTERGGAVHLIESDGTVTPLGTFDVRTVSESGLHGVAIDPDFARNNFVYFYYTYRAMGNETQNRVVRTILEDNILSHEVVIVDGIPGASTHDGGRIKFGPDKYLYITTGDAQNPSQSQDLDSLAGKILRVTREGAPAPGNSLGTLVYSYGHRNPQGITWDDKGRLWATEHGPSAHDELNLIESGKNYGWPFIQGNEQEEGMETPILHSGTTTWAPAGAQFLDGTIFFTGLRGSALYAYDIETDTLTTYLKDKLGRIRDVVVGPDGFLYIATSNRDGRGIPGRQDDRIFRINPSKLSEL